MDKYILSEAVPMHGRMIHSISGEKKLLPYSGRAGEYINSISRAGLNIALMNEAERSDGVTFHFDQRLVDFEPETGKVEFATGDSAVHETVIATDGAGSAVRRAMLDGGVRRFDFSSQWLEHGYKELHIPATADGVFRLEQNALHIWPRQSFMMIALPNADGSFTCTLFLAHRRREGSDAAAFDQLTSPKEVYEFFEREFADVVPLMPGLIQDFFANPTGDLGTIKCYPWNVGGRCLLLGDAAHAIVPFYGQGMNCAFEDVRVLDQLIEEQGTHWETVYENYGSVRKVNTDAIADMAVENFYEMRDATADPVFQRKRELETKLEAKFPEYFSKYSMVTFREDLPYSVARSIGAAQDALLMRLAGDVAVTDKTNLDDIMSEIRGL
jgi:kynurenine 3-monooxygenase